MNDLVFLFSKKTKRKNIVRGVQNGDTYHG